MADMSENGIVILGVIGLFGNTLAVVVGAFLSARNARRAQEDASKAQLATLKAAEALEITKRSVAESTRELISEARQTSKKVSTVGRIVEDAREISRDTNQVTHTTHTIVNGQHLKLLRAIMLLAERIAHDHPDDHVAQDAAAGARTDYENSLLANTTE